MQGIIVIDHDHEAVCQLCSGHQEKLRVMMILDECEHLFHMKCFLKHACAHHISCPICNAGVYDIRLSVARAFDRNSLTELVGCLV